MIGRERRPRSSPGFGLTVKGKKSIQPCMTGVIVVDDCQRIILFGPAAEELLLYSENEMINQPFDILLSAQEIPAHLFEDPLNKGLSNRGLVTRHSGILFRRKDGTLFVLDVTRATVSGNGELRTFLFLHDATGLTEARERLEKIESRHKELVDFLPQTVFEMDESGGLIFVNRTAFAQFGYTERDFDQGLNALDMIVPEERDRAKNSIREALSGKRYGSGEEVTALRKDGSTFPAIVFSSPIVQEGKSVGLRGFIVDNSERKRAEEKIAAYQKQLLSLASDLALAEERERRSIATTLHDRIGQTLAFTRLKLGALLEAGSSGVLNEGLEEVHGLIEQVIDETRSLIFEVSPPVLYEMGFEAAAEWLGEKFQQKSGISIEVRDDGQPKPLGRDVRVFLFQALRELLVNVVKHARAEHAWVSITREEDSIQVTVEDDGRGFDLSEIRSSGGFTGFGLFNIQQRLKYLDGHFEVDSKPDQGTRVMMTVRMANDQQARKRLGEPS
jgi:PAS domain S-box-containing protein